MADELKVIPMPHRYAPPWALWVVGVYSDRDEDGELYWSAECRRCGAHYPPQMKGAPAALKCTSGMVRRRIGLFASDHVKCEEKKT